MFNINPFKALDQTLLNLTQRFALYTLDHYGILVSRWAYIFSIIFMLEKPFYFILTVTDTGTIALNWIYPVFMLLDYVIWVSPALNFLKLEKRGQITQFNIRKITMQSNFVMSLRLIVIVIGLMLCYQKFYTMGNSWNLKNIYYIVSCLSITSYVYFISVFTREREPPLKGFQTAWSAT